MSLIPFFGEGHLLWASDYPHPDSVWPNSRAAIERQMKHLSPEMRRKLTRDNRPDNPQLPAESVISILQRGVISILRRHRVSHG